MTHTEAWKIHNPEGKFLVLATKRLVGERWLEVLAAHDCRVEIYDAEEMFGEAELIEAIGTRCDGALGQLNEPWNERVLTHFAAAGGKVISTYAVGVNNIDLACASRLGIAVCNTPGVLTEATAELALALVFAAIRRIAEGDRYMREGRFLGWLPQLMLGRQVTGRTLGLFGAGRIGQTVARALAGGFGMNVLYFNPHPRPELENYIADLAAVAKKHGQPVPSVRRTEDLDELFAQSDILVLLSSYSPPLHHLVDARRLSLMKSAAVLVNASRGPVIDEAALITHLKAHPEFTAGLDVFEFEPRLVDGLTELPNIVLSPHTGSATLESRSNMATLAALNCAGVLSHWPANTAISTTTLATGPMQKLVPSLLNAKELAWPTT
jgi:hydroxypyruvate reductase 1